MRFLVPILSAFVLAACATSQDNRFRVGESERAFVIIGVAKTQENREARYTMLWRQIDETGNFAELSGRTSFEAQTNQGNTLRIRGTPGEFEMREIEPGVYALDSVFAVIRERGVDYVADGVIAGPARPAFEVRPGEAVYLGIWEADIDEARAIARLWRLTQEDLRAVLHNSDKVLGQVRLRSTHNRSVPCTPRQLTTVSRRQVC